MALGLYLCDGQQEVPRDCSLDRTTAGHCWTHDSYNIQQELQDGIPAIMQLLPVWVRYEYISEAYKRVTHISTSGSATLRELPSGKRDQQFSGCRSLCSSSKAS